MWRGSRWLTIFTITLLGLNSRFICRYASVYSFVFKMCSKNSIYLNIFILLVSVSTDFWIKCLIFLFQIGVYSRCLFTLFLSTCLRVFSILIDLTHTLIIYTKNKLGIVNLQRIKDRFSDDTWNLMGMDNVGMNFCFQKTGSRRDFTRSCNGSRAIFLLTGLTVPS